MISEFSSDISIEKFASFLDGNLSADEMNDILFMVENDVDLLNIVDMNDIIDDTYIDNVIGHEMELPFELQSTDFELPQITKLVDGMATEVGMCPWFGFSEVTSPLVPEEVNMEDYSTDDFIAFDESDTIGSANQDDFPSEADCYDGDMDSLGINDLEY